MLTLLGHPVPGFPDFFDYVPLDVALKIDALELPTAEDQTLRAKCAIQVVHGIGSAVPPTGIRPIVLGQNLRFWGLDQFGAITLAAGRAANANAQSTDLLPPRGGAQGVNRQVWDTVRAEISSTNNEMVGFMVARFIQRSVLAQPIAENPAAPTPVPVAARGGRGTRGGDGGGPGARGRGRGGRGGHVIARAEDTAPGHAPASLQRGPSAPPRPAGPDDRCDFVLIAAENRIFTLERPTYDPHNHLSRESSAGQRHCEMFLLSQLKEFLRLVIARITPQAKGRQPHPLWNPYTHRGRFEVFAQMYIEKPAMCEACRAQWADPAWATHYVDTFGFAVMGGGGRW